MNNFNYLIKKNLNSSIELKNRLINDENVALQVSSIATELISAFKRGNKVLFCGNGGSAADAQHLAAELSGRYYYDRPPLFAEALHVNGSYLTAVANDYSFEEIYARMIQGVGVKGDVLIALSTSGKSPNIIKAILAAQKQEMIVIGFTGEHGGKMNDMCNYLIKVPSSDTPRIQECHMLIGHTLCEIIEKEIFPKKDVH